MSVPNHHPKFLVELNKDCLFHIFSHLQLPDLLNIRLCCSTLDVAVREHLPHLATMSVVYSEHVINDSYDKTSLTEKEKKIIVDVDERIDNALQNFPQNDFQRNDIITIHGRKKFEKFLKFIKKYEIKNITKLALIIDSDKLKFTRDWCGIFTIPAASELLELCSKVETLFLDRTHRDYDDYIVFQTEPLRRLFSTIDELVELKALYFFTRRESCIILRCYNGNGRSDDESDNDDETDSDGYDDEVSNLMIGNFFATMLNKLHLFSMNREDSDDYHFYAPEYLIPLFGQNFDTIQHLSTQGQDIKWLTNSETTFKNLRSLTLFDEDDLLRFKSINVSSFEQLRVLYLDDSPLPLSETFMLNLNRLPNLEKLYGRLYYVALNIHSGERIDDQYINRTIKHICVVRSSGIAPEEDEPRFTDFFQGLLTVTICQPDEVVYERHQFHLI